MSGIYIHIPFCSKACHYCDFHFSTQKKNIDLMVLAIIKELKSRKKEIKEPIKTIYFGGGTPSILSVLQLNDILNTINIKYTIDSNVEITLEANPEDLSEKKLKALFMIGVNRLSIGVQSLNDDVLQWMNRNHDLKQAKRSVELANKIGFKNISVDFIYGTPKNINRSWEKEIKELVSYPITHLSAYHLTIEPKTFFSNQLKKGVFNTITQEESLNEYLKLVDILNDNNIMQYEVSNFAKQGFKSIHNTSYWQQKKYIGIGPSAHSYDGDSRRWNISNNTGYIKKVNNKEVFYEAEQLTSLDKFNELIMVGLRTENGFNLKQANSFLNCNHLKEFTFQLKKLLSNSTIQQKENQISMFENKLMLAEHATRELFILNE
ncbi:MAG: radical SAM family heme chaperone HemW [Flavobacteriales bacterium]|nr:radical SAM family heme chaperone HemW [Flavobacteriales bacterium]